MEIKIETSVEQPLLSRKVVSGFIGFEGSTPSRADLRKKIAEALKVDESRVAVEGVHTFFGQAKAKFSANIYPSADVLDKTESVVVLARHGLREKKVAKQAGAK